MWSTEERTEDTVTGHVLSLRALLMLARDPWLGETYDLMMFPRVWSSLLMVNKQALGTLVSLLMVILQRDRSNSSSPHPVL